MTEKTTSRNSSFTMPDFGKVPPQSTQVEEAVLGAVLVDSSCIDDVAEILTPGMFYKDAHQKIYAAALELYKKSKFADLVSVTNHLRDISELEMCGGPIYLTRLTKEIVSTAMVPQHCHIIKTSYIQREMIRIGTELQTRGFDPMIETEDLLEYAEKELYELGDTANKKEAVTIGIILKRIADTIAIRESAQSELIGVPSGITELDRITMGWQPGDLIIIAARPSMGKSALAIQFARFAAQLKHPALLFSLEMTDAQLGERYLTSETGHDSYDLKRGRNIIWSRIEKALHDNSKTPLWIDDSAHMTIYEFRSKVRRAKKRYGIEVVICDYLNLFTGSDDKDNMSEKYGSISKMFKQVAKDCKVAVIALAQLNRSPEMRAIQFPKLSDLRNSGEIEQDADIVIFPIRYRMVGMLSDENNRDLSEMARIDVAKNRNGRTDSIDVRVSDDCMQWGLPVEDVFPVSDKEAIDFTESVKDKKEPF